MGILEVLGLKDLAAYGDYKRSQQDAQKDLSAMLARTGRTGETSTLADAGARELEQQTMDTDRATKRAGHLSAVYSKTEIAFNQRQMEAGFARVQKSANTAAFQQAVGLARAELDTAATRENLRRSLSGDGRAKLTDPATDQKVQAALDRLIERKAADTLGGEYSAKIILEVKTLYQGKLGHLPTDAEVADLLEKQPNEYNAYMQAALAGLEETDAAATGRVGLAHYDSRHTRPGEADMLGRVGAAISPDLKQKSVNSGNYGATVTEITPGGPVSRIVPTPTYAGQTGGSPLPGGIALNPANLRRERQTNNVSTVKSAEAGLFLIEDAMAQAWEQAALNPLAQNVGAESQNLTYEFGGYRAPMAYDGGLGDTYSTSGMGLGSNNNSLTSFNKIKSRLDNVTLTRNNPGAKVLMKQDKGRGGYDPYTMYSQLAAGTGMRSLQRAPGIGGAAGPVQMGGSYALTTQTNWDDEGKAQAARLETAAAVSSGAAAAGLQAAQTDQVAARTLATAADQAFAASVKAAGKGEQYGLLQAVSETVAAEAEGAALAALLLDANALFAAATARVPAPNATVAGLPATDPRVVQIATKLAEARTRCQDQVAAVQGRITANAKRLADTGKALTDVVTGSGRAMTDPAVIDLIAKGRAKVVADTGAEEAQALVEAAQALLAKATADEHRAKEDRATIDAGGFEPFLLATLAAAKLKAKTDLDAAVTSAATPAAKAKVLEDLLAQADAEQMDVRFRRMEECRDALARSEQARQDAADEHARTERHLQDAIRYHATEARSGRDPDAVATAKLVVDAEQDAADIAKARRDAAALLADRQSDALWDQLAKDEAQNLRVEGESLTLAAEMGQAKNVGPAKLNDARIALAGKLATLQAGLAAFAAAGDAMRAADAALAGYTQELVGLQRRLTGLKDAEKALGVGINAALTDKITKATQLEAKVQIELAAAKSALVDATAEREKQDLLVAPAREAVKLARRTLAEATA